LANLNPIIVDHVGTGGNPPADADLSVSGDPYGLATISSHQLNKRLFSVNAAYADGHVEVIPGNAVRPRFKGNWWNWR
jgi:prepilin-type processing-associated H-X9-DG protein